MSSSTSAEELYKQTIIRPQEQDDFLSGKRSYFDVLYAAYTPCGQLYTKFIEPAIPTAKKRREKGIQVYQSPYERGNAQSSFVVNTTDPDRTTVRTSRLTPMERTQMKNSLMLKPDSDEVKDFKKCMEKYETFYEIRQRNLDEIKTQLFYQVFEDRSTDAVAASKRR